MRNVPIHSLSKLPLFRGLTDEELLKLNRCLRVKKVLPGASITPAGQGSQIVYIILSGVVYLQIEQLNGTTLILAVLETGEVIGAMQLKDRLEYSTNVVAKEETTLLWIDYASFREYLSVMPVLTFNLTGLLANQLQIAYKKLQLLAAREVHERVAGHLIALAEKYGQQCDNGEVYIPRRLTQSEMADHVGASRVRVNQAIALFKRGRYISIDQHFHFTIHNWTALAAIAGLCW